MKTTRQQRRRQRKEEPPPQETWNLKLVYDQWTDVTRQADPDEKWDGDDLAHSYDVKGYTIGDNITGWDFVLPGKPDKNKTYWLVYVSYSTGDSFHHETGCVDWIEVFEDANDADHLGKVLEEDYRKFEEDGGHHNFKPVKVKFPSGVEKEYSTGTWKGYFERLESVHVEAIEYRK